MSKKPESQSTPYGMQDFNVRIEIDEDVYKKIMHWIDKAPGEVSGFGNVEFDPELNVLRVVDAHLVKQKNTGGSTEVDANALAKLMYETRDNPGELRWWWHSHVNMDVFWSGTDTTTIKQLGAHEWFIATVFNKKREMKSAYIQALPVRMFIDNLETQVMEYVDADLLDEWNDEYDRKCEVVTYAPPKKDGKEGEKRSTESWYFMEDDAEDLPLLRGVNQNTLDEYADMFGVDNIPAEVRAYIARQEANDDKDAARAEEMEESQKLDLGSGKGPVHKKSWKDFNRS